MLTVISFPPGLRLRQFCPSGSRLGFGAGGWNWRDTGGILVFSSGLTVLLHLRASTGGFRCALPDGVGSPGAGLSQTQPVGKSSESRFKAVSAAGVSLWCYGCHEGICGRCWRFLRHSSGGSGGCSSPAVLGRQGLPAGDGGQSGRLRGARDFDSRLAGNPRPFQSVRAAGLGGLPC